MKNNFQESSFTDIYSQSLQIFPTRIEKKHICFYVDNNHDIVNFIDKLIAILPTEAVTNYTFTTFGPKSKKTTLNFIKNKLGIDYVLIESKIDVEMLYHRSIIFVNYSNNNFIESIDINEGTTETARKILITLNNLDS